MIVRTPEHITLFPFKKQFTRELLITIAGVAGGGLYGYLSASPQHRGIGWGIAGGVVLVSGGLLAVPLPSSCGV